MFHLRRHGDIMGWKPAVEAGTQGDIFVSMATDPSDSATAEEVHCGLITAVRYKDFTVPAAGVFMTSWPTHKLIK